MHPDAATWCAESRRALLSSRNQRGDLPLADVGDAGWTLERLHLCEHPPRFPRIYFKFASDALEKGAKRRVKRVARLLIRHPRLLVRIHGFAQPNAPNIIGEALSQERDGTLPPLPVRCTPACAILLLPAVRLEQSLCERSYCSTWQAVPEAPSTGGRQQTAGSRSLARTTDQQEFRPNRVRLWRRG